MRNVRAILIDPFACTITEVEHDADNYKNIYGLLSHESMIVECFTACFPDCLQPGEAIFVDDEGLLKSCDRFFIYKGYDQPLAGKGLILGSDNDGETIGATSGVKSIARHTLFLARLPQRLVSTNTPWHKKNNS